MHRSIVRIVPLLIVGLIVSAGPALAGPPLLCHPFDIGTNRSLPWSDTNVWWQGRAGYDVKHLVADTAALLTTSTPVLVRMETLRRAAIYASGDGQVASQLLAVFDQRAKDAARAGTASETASMAFFDAGYLAETFRQITHLGQTSEFRDRARTIAGVLGTTDGYALLNRSISLRPQDPSLQFAAALISADKDRATYQQHAARARKGAAQDALLARNLNHIS
jgi:hypothetical protein